FGVQRLRPASLIVRTFRSEPAAGESATWYSPAFNPAAFVKSFADFPQSGSRQFIRSSASFGARAALAIETNPAASMIQARRFMMGCELHRLSRGFQLQIRMPATRTQGVFLPRKNTETTKDSDPE